MSSFDDNVKAVAENMQRDKDEIVRLRTELLDTRERFYSSNRRIAELETELRITLAALARATAGDVTV